MEKRTGGKVSADFINDAFDSLIEGSKACNIRYVILAGIDGSPMYHRLHSIDTKEQFDMLKRYLMEYLDEIEESLL